MADVVDFANDLAEAEREFRIRTIASRPPVAVATGSCLQCNEPTPEGRRWCEAACRDKWERSRRR